MNMRIVSLSLILVSVALHSYAEVFHWTKDNDEWGKFADVKNWEVGNPATNAVAATSLPSEKDRLGDQKTFHFDLDGKTQAVKEWHALCDWKRHGLFLRNGTLEITGSMITHGGPIEIEKGATLSFAKDALFLPGRDDAGPRVVTVKDGGLFQMQEDSKLDIYNLALIVETNGVARVSTHDVRITHGGQRSRIENFGTLNFEKGFNLQKGSAGATLTIQQKDGVFETAGNISTNEFKTKFSVELIGGIVRAIKSTRFDVMKLLLKKDATINLETAKNAVLDMSQLTQEPNSRVVAKGEGFVAFGRVMPENLEVQSGGLGLYGSGKIEGLSSVKLAKGTTILLGASDIELTGEPSAPCTYQLDISRVTIGACVVRCDNKTLRMKVKSDVQKKLPDDLILEEKGNGLFLATKYFISKKGVNDWQKKSAWSIGKLPSHHQTTVRGKGTCALLKTSSTGATSILVTDGATLRVEADVSLPPVILRGDAKLEIGSSSSKAMTVRALQGLTIEALADAKPKIVIGAKANLILRENEVALDAADVDLKGKVKWVAKAELKTWTDHVNRCFYISAENIDKAASSYVYRYPDFSDLKETDFKKLSMSRTRRFPIFHSRLKKGDTTPFNVAVEVTRTNGTILIQHAKVTPKENPLTPPIENHNILVGQTLYGTNWFFRDLLVTNEECNLIACWGKADKLLSSTMSKEVLDKATRDNMYFMTIYGYCSREVQETLKKEYGNRYLFDNIGEYAGGLYTWGKGNTNEIYRNVIECKDKFVENWIQKAFERSHRNADFMFSTSGSALANYELEGGIEYICNELYAVGAHNLAYASSEARGAARRWGPEFWCSWLAAEWQSQGVPYHTMQKYGMLLAGYLQQYLMGTSIMVLESGALTTQAHDYTVKQNKVKEETFDYSPTRYRETTKEFYDFVRRNPRAKGTPETNIGFILGNGDAFLGNNDSHYAVWAAQSTAGTNDNWRYRSPEFMWTRIQGLFFPLRRESLAPCGNGWLAGNPYGQCDVICVDDLARYEDVKRYKLMSFVGWNTATDEAMAVMDHYVKNGGILVQALAHASTRIDREYAKYTRGDLISPYKELVEDPIKVKGAVTATPEAIAAFPALTKSLSNVVFKNDVELAPLAKNVRDKWQTVVAVNGHPLVVSRKEGKGTRYLFLSWDYPSDKQLGIVYGAIMTALAESIPQTLTMEIVSPETADDRNFLCTAVYGEIAYILNMDCNNKRRINLRMGKRVIPLELEPCSMYELSIRTGKVKQIFSGPKSKTLNPPLEKTP